MKKPETVDRLIRFSVELNEAIEEFCKEHDRTFSEVVRTGAAKEIGKKALAKIRKVGRPKKERE